MGLRTIKSRFLVFPALFLFLENLIYEGFSQDKVIIIIGFKRRRIFPPSNFYRLRNPQSLIYGQEESAASFGPGHRRPRPGGTVRIPKTVSGIWGRSPPHQEPWRRRSNRVHRHCDARRYRRAPPFETTNKRKSTIVDFLYFFFFSQPYICITI